MVLERKKLTVQLVSHRSRFKVTFHLPYPINVYIHCINIYIDPYEPIFSDFSNTKSELSTIIFHRPCN